MRAVTLLRLEQITTNVKDLIKFYWFYSIRENLLYVYYNYK